MGSRAFGFAAALAAAAICGTARAESSCDRTCLSGVMHSYIHAVLKHDPKLAPFGAHARFTENGQVLALGDGLWGTASGLGAYKLHFNDEKAGQAGFMGVVEENAHPDIVLFRLKVAAGKIVEVETVVSRPGGLNKPEGLVDKPVFSQALPADQRRSRAEMIGVVRAYLHALIEAKGQPSLFTPDCTRVEDGVTTANNPDGDKMARLSCGDQLETGVSGRLSRIREPRFPLVDEERGLVHVVMFFDHAGNKPATTVHYKDGTSQEIGARSDSPFSYMCAELFKLEGGKIRQIEVVLLQVPYGMGSGWPAPVEAR